MPDRPNKVTSFIMRRVRRLPLLYLIIAGAVFIFQRTLLYIPSHHARRGELQPCRYGMALASAFVVP